MKKSKIFWLLISMSALTFFFATKDVVWAQAPSAPSSATKPSNPPDDSAITAAVQSALKKEKWMEGTDFTVSSKDGVVTISGPVRTHADIQRALMIARQTPGVSKAKSQMKVLALPHPTAAPE